MAPYTVPGDSRERRNRSGRQTVIRDFEPRRDRREAGTTEGTIEDTRDFLTADKQFPTEFPAELRINAPRPTRTQAAPFRTSAGPPGLGLTTAVSADPSAGTYPTLAISGLRRSLGIPAVGVIAIPDGGIRKSRTQAPIASRLHLPSSHILYEGHCGNQLQERDRPRGRAL